MHQYAYALGNNIEVYLEALQDERNDKIVSLTEDNSDSPFVLQLTNFSGKLLVRNAVGVDTDAPLLTPVRAMHDDPSKSKSKTNKADGEWHDDKDDPRPFSLALGDPQKLIAEMSFAPGSPRDKTLQASQEATFTENDGAEVNTNDDGDDDENDSSSNTSNADVNIVSKILKSGYIPEDPNNKPRGIELFRKIVRKVIDNQPPLRNNQGGTSGDMTGVHPSWLKQGGRWAELLKAAAVREKVSDKIREKRQRVRDLSKTHGDDIEFPSNLHRLCAEPEVTLEELEKALEENPKAVSIGDKRGRLPLHIIGDNDHLVATKAGRQTATSFCWALMYAYPLAISTRDSRRLMPFVAIIEDWIIYVYDKYKRSKKMGLPGSTDNKVMDRIRNAKANAEAGIRGSALNAGYGQLQRDTPDAFLFSNKSKKNIETKRQEIHSYSQHAHPDHIELWDEVKWCFEMLSMAMDELAGKNGGLFKARRASLIHHAVKDTTARTKLATHLCERIPALFKTMLLLDGEADYSPKRLLKLSIFRRCLLCHESVGPWLLNMLQSRSANVPNRAVDYLELVSAVDVTDYVGTFRSVLPGDHQTFRSLRSKVFEEVNNLEGVTASLEVLESGETERAAATSVVMNIFDKNLRRPFVVSLVLIDFVLHITLMLAFKRDVSYEGGDGDDAIGNVPTQVVMFISCHYFIRKCCEAFNLFKISPKVFRGYFTNIWTFFDFISIILVLSAITWNEKNPDQYRQGLNAFVLGLLWTKVLGFLKVVNKEMSTFILSLVQILQDLRYFMIVMAVVIFMFGDMMHIALSTKEDGNFCKANDDLSGPEEDFCSSQNIDSYLRVYSLLLGDFELDDYKRNNGIVVLFVIFTMMGVIILLNVLIAVISDSYERAKIRSSSLFGRARVTFVAQNEALESFLRPGTDPTEGLEFINSKRRRVMVVASRLFRVLVLVAIIITTMSAEVYLVTRAYGLVINKDLEIVTLVVVFTLTLVLTLALLVVVNFALEGAIRNHVPGIVGRTFKMLDEGSQFFVRRLAKRLFGLSDAIERGDHDSGEEEWVSRLDYIEQMFEKSLGEAKTELQQDIKEFEKRLNENQVEAEKRLEHKDENKHNESDKPGIPGMNLGGIFRR